jgi:cytochrome c oxidase cbb3-type subunit 3
MSDFVNGFWSLYVGILTLVSVIACGVLLWVVGRVRVKAGNQDNTTGHVWDEDLRELNNPLPRWWMWLFYITIVFGLAYLALYPGLGSFAGQWQWSQVDQYKAEVQQADARLGPLYAQFEDQTVPALARDGRALAIGERLFMNNCAQCHGSDARGSKGFPDLTDADWLYGGTPDLIKQSIAQGRHGAMPPMGQALAADDVQNVVQYVLSLSGTESDAVRANLGRSKFAVCAACHGPAGKGNAALGAPNLADRVWLHGGGSTNVLDTVLKGRDSVMPAHEGKLTPAQIHLLTAYIWQLSGGASNTP